MSQRRWGRLCIECVRGDIANQPDIDAVVNAANAALRPGSGVAGALHRAAGPGLYEECRPLAPIATGEAVMTSGHGLPNPWVIHCLGPVYGRDRPEAELLVAWKGYVKALTEALGPEERRSLEQDVLGRARAVAEAAGGFLGLGNPVSDAEQRMLEELAGAFSD